MKNIMKEAHNLTKKIIRKGDSYKATFRICLSFVHSEIRKGENKMVELKGSEKQVKWANDIRENFIVCVNFAKELVGEIGVTEFIQEELEDNGFNSIAEAFETIEKQENASIIIKKLKGYDFLGFVKREKAKLEANRRILTVEAILEEKECIVANIIMNLADIK